MNRANSDVHLLFRDRVADAIRYLKDSKGLELKERVARFKKAIDAAVVECKEWDELKHPRDPKGTTTGGQWVSITGTRIMEAAKAGKSSMDLHRDKDGNWTKERMELHERIIEAVLKNGVVSNDLQAFIIGGAPANGKTTLLESGVFITPQGTILIAPDEIKKLLPEYSYLVAKKYVKASEFVHEESSYISNEILERAIKRKYNLTIDKIFNEGAAKVISKLDYLKKQGYNVQVNYVTLHLQQALKNAEDRFKKTNRYISGLYIRATDRDMPSTVRGVMKAGYYVDLWDTNRFMKPRIVAQARGGKISIKDQNLWSNFLKKRHG